MYTTTQTLNKGKNAVPKADTFALTVSINWLMNLSTNTRHIIYNTCVICILNMLYEVRVDMFQCHKATFDGILLPARTMHNVGDSLYAIVATMRQCNCDACGFVSNSIA